VIWRSATSGPAPGAWYESRIWFARDVTPGPWFRRDARMPNAQNAVAVIR